MEDNNRNQIEIVYEISREEWEEKHPIYIKFSRVFLTVLMSILAVLLIILYYAVTVAALWLTILAVIILTIFSILWNTWMLFTKKINARLGKYECKHCGYKYTIFRKRCPKCKTAPGKNTPKQ